MFAYMYACNFNLLYPFIFYFLYFYKIIALVLNNREPLKHSVTMDFSVPLVESIEISQRALLSLFE